jgi:hypothetical protein
MHSERAELPDIDLMSIDGIVMLCGTIFIDGTVMKMYAVSDDQHLHGERRYS